MTFKYVELFAGIGGFRSALDALGGECVLASEIDPFTTRAYQALYNGAPELRGDVTMIDTDDIPDHDLLVGGFPCQSFSVAGKRGGFADTRGTLFFEIARIASAKRPKLLLLENVKGLLSHDGGNTFETMCAVLNDIGYAIDFAVLNSKHFGVPQNRERIFIVASRDARDSQWRINTNDVVSKARRRAEAIGVKTFNFNWPTNNTVTAHLHDVMESDVNERYYLSDEKAATLVLGGTAVEDSINVIGRVTGLNGHDLCKRVYGIDGIAPTIPTGSSGNTIPTGSSGNTIPKIAVVNNRGKLVARQDDVGTALDANYWKGMDNHGQRTMVVEFTPRTRVRKLTPRECFRVQSFTDIQHDTVSAAGISDSQLYKMAGNAVTVSVIRAIGNPLIKLLTQLPVAC